VCGRLVVAAGGLLGVLLFLFVSLDSKSILIVDLATLAVVKTLDLETAPIGVASDAAGKHVYAFADAPDSSVLLIDVEQVIGCLQTAAAGQPRPDRPGRGCPGPARRLARVRLPRARRNRP